MAEFITPDWVYEKIQQRSNETAVMYRDRLSDMMLDETEDPMVRRAANERLWQIMSYEQKGREMKEPEFTCYQLMLISHAVLTSIEDISNMVDTNVDISTLDYLKDLIELYELVEPFRNSCEGMV